MRRHRAARGLARSDTGAAALTAAGAEVHRGALDDLDSLQSGAVAADGLIHLAYIHDFSDIVAAGLTDLRAVETIGAARAPASRSWSPREHWSLRRASRDGRGRRAGRSAPGRPGERGRVDGRARGAGVGHAASADRARRAMPVVSIAAEDAGQHFGWLPPWCRSTTRRRAH